MNKDQRIEKIIEEILPILIEGQESLDSILAKYPQEAAELRPNLEAAGWLVESRRRLEPRPGFVASSRAHLEQRLAALPQQSFWRRLLRRYSPGRWAFNLASPVILILLIVLVANSLVLAARLSIPGDPLYATKLAIESLRLAITPSPRARANLYIQYSRERTTEFVELVLEGDYGQLPAAASRLETGVIAALHSIDDLSAQDPAIEKPMIFTLKDTLSGEITMLTMLKETTPSSAAPGIELAIQVAQSGVMALR